MIAYKRGFFALIVIALLPMQVIAQSSSSLDDHILVTIPSALFPRQAMWSNDSQRLVFHEYADGLDISINMPEGKDQWIQYDMLSNTVTRHTRWPLQPQLSPEELALLSPAVGESGEESLIFESPNGNYIACLCGGITVYSRLQQEFVNLPYTVIEPFMGSDEFTVFWSQNESAFIYSTRNVWGAGGDFIAHISNFTSDVADAEVEAVIAGFEIRGNTYSNRVRNYQIVREKVHDISSDGKHVLVGMRLIDLQNPGNKPLRLIVWNVSDPDASAIIDDIDIETIKGASFIGENTTDLLVINDEGLIQYDVSSKTNSLLASSLPASEAYFSLDSRYVALTCCIDLSGPQTVTILDLQQLVPLVVPTPTSEE